MRENKKEVRCNSYIKIEIVKKYYKYKVGDKYCLLCMEKKLAIASYVI